MHLSNRPYPSAHHYTTTDTRVHITFMRIYIYIHCIYWYSSGGTVAIYTNIHIYIYNDITYAQVRACAWCESVYHWYLCVRVCCLRFSKGFVIRELVIFQFLCVPRGTVKSSQTVRAERARDAVVSVPLTHVVQCMYRIAMVFRRGSRTHLKSPLLDGGGMCVG